MREARSILRDLTPPLLLAAYRNARHGAAKRRFGLRGDYDSWARAVAASTGYHAAGILDQTLEATIAVRDGRAAYESDGITFGDPSYRWDTLAALLWVAARDKGRLEVLDFGGSLGTTYWRHLDFLQRIPNLGWSVVEQAAHVRAGRQHLQTDTLRFYETMEDSAARAAPNVLLLGGVLQYLESPYAVIRTAAELGVPTIVMDRTHIWDGPRDVLTVQRVRPEHYDASYPSWIFSSARLVSELQDAGFPVLPEFAPVRPGNGDVDYAEGGLIAEWVERSQ